MRLRRLQIALDDVPGRLGSVAAALGGLGINILDVDVHTVTSGQRVDELLVDLVLPMDLPAVDHAVRSAGGSLLAAEAADPHELRDPVTAALDAVHSAASSGTTATAIEDAARFIVRADLAWFSRPAVGGDAGVIGRVLEAGSPVQEAACIKRLGRGPAWSLGVPCALSGVLVMIRRGPKFTYTETARVQALLRLVDALSMDGGKMAALPPERRAP